MLKQCPREGCRNRFEPTINYGYETKYCSPNCANSRPGNAGKSYRLTIYERPFDELGRDSKRKRIIFEQNEKCNRCGLDKWLGEDLILEFEHKDGDSTNDTRENLECLCPNCHSLTATWRGRNKTTVKIVTDEMLIEALSSSRNIRQALIKVKLAPKGGNYNRAKRLLEQMDL